MDKQTQILKNFWRSQSPPCSWQAPPQPGLTPLPTASKTTAAPRSPVTDSTDKTVSAASGDAATSPWLTVSITAITPFAHQHQGDLHLVTSAAMAPGASSMPTQPPAAAASTSILQTTAPYRPLGKSPAGRTQRQRQQPQCLSGHGRFLSAGQLQGRSGHRRNVTSPTAPPQRPVFDNRYGSLYIDYDPATHSSSYVDTYYGQLPGGVATGSNLVLNGGVVDLTWDNAKRTDARQLSAEYSGSGAFIINTNITQNPLQGTSVVANSDLLQLRVFNNDATMTLK